MVGRMWREIPVIRKLVTGLVAASSGALTLGLVSMGGIAVTASDGGAYYKREDQSSELVAVAEEDDGEDDEFETGTASGTGTAAGNGTNGTFTQQAGQTGTGTATNTGGDNSTSDMTGSLLTAVSRDGEPSRADVTSDRTRDGGDLTWDLTSNLTNDASRNDTRG